MAWAVTPEARALYQKLYRISRDGVTGKTVYGQQSAHLEGRGWSVSKDSDSSGNLPESDLHRAFGVDPGLVGFDFSQIGPGSSILQERQMRAIHQAGGVVELSWHMPNFKADGSETNAWDTSGNTVGAILSDEGMKTVFFSKIDSLASFLLRVKDVPVVFRPWHEHNYSWFWWGKDHCTPEEYRSLWRLTVSRLGSKGVHNLIYAYSPNNVEADYFERYPGDGSVDILGVDMYFKSALSNLANLGPSPLDEWKMDVIRLLNAAVRKNKIPAVTEFGNEGITYPQFWTDYFSWPIERAGMDQFAGSLGIRSPGIKMAFSMLWRNDPVSPNHFFSPFPGAPGNANFKQLLDKRVVAFRGDF